MSNTLLINILHGLFLVVYCMRVRLCDTFGCIVILWNCDASFWAMIFMDLWGMFWALNILFFSLWNSPVTPGRNLLSEGMGRGHKEFRQNLLLEWPGSLGLWLGLGTRVWSFYGFEILQGIAEGPIVFLRMKDASVLYFDAYMSG